MECRSIQECLSLSCQQDRYKVVVAHDRMESDHSSLLVVELAEAMSHA